MPDATGDPLEVLRLPVAPVVPRPEFAATLRRRVVAALAEEEEDMTRTADVVGADASGAVAGTGAGSVAGPGVQAEVTPYLAVHDARAALAFYADVFEAVETMRIEEPDGRLGHAEFAIGPARFMLSDEYPEIGVAGPRTLGGSAVMLHLEVPDVDATTARAASAGAEVVRPPADQFHGNRNAVVVDPFGHRWMLSTPIGPASSVPKLGYFTIQCPDVDRAQAFYGTLFGWEAVPGSMPEGLHVANTEPHGGMLGGREPGVVPSFRVADVEAAVVRVRELGGSAGEPVASGSGWSAECTDDQGVRFSLWQPAPGY